MGFTTGTNSSGYNLQGVTLKMGAGAGSPTGLTAAIHADSASSQGNPAGSATYTLTGPTSPVANAQNTWSCSGVCSLDKDTEYFLVLSPTVPSTGNHLYQAELTRSDNQTNTPADAGWSLADVIKTSANGGTWADSVPGDTLKFKVTATPKVRAYLTASGITDTTATLNITNPYGTWWRQWWYQRATPSGDTTCHSVAAGTATASLSNLTASTPYTYKAYDASGCNSADEIASVTFATTPVSVSNLGETSDVNFDFDSTTLGAAAAFTTGSNSGGYTLQSVTVEIADVQGSPTATVAIHASSGGDPAASATYTLTGPTTPQAHSQNTWSCAVTADVTCSLDADTDYFLVLFAANGSWTNSYAVETTVSDDETNAPDDAGWSIANVYKRGPNPWDEPNPPENTLKFKVRAAAK